MALKTHEQRLDSAIRIFFYLMILWLPYSKAMIEISVITVLVLWIAKRMLRLFNGQKFTQAFAFPDSPLNGPIFVFCVFCLFSVVGSSMPQQSLVGFINKTLEWFIIYFLVLEVFVKEKHFTRVRDILMVTVLVTSLDALLQFYWLKKDIFFQYQLVDQYRVTAAFRHPNLLGGFLSLAVPFLLAQLFIQDKRIYYKVFIWMTFIAAVWALVLTFSRGAMEGAIAGVVGFGIVYLYRHNRAWLLRGSIAAVLVLIFALLPVFMLKQQVSAKVGESPTAQWRSNLWLQTLLLIHDRPFLGHGLNTYMPVMRDFIVETKNPLANGFSPSYAHNCYLQITAETGVLGFAAFCGVLFMLFYPLSSIPRKEHLPDSQMTWLWFGALAGGFGFLVHSFVEINFYSLQLPALFWFMAGGAVALDKLLSKKRKYVIKEA